jgi:hypothetical protein
MGNSPTSQRSQQNEVDPEATKEKVYLNVYTLPEEDLPKFLSIIPGFGVYHSGVEVYGTEYAFDGSYGGTFTGVFSSRPKTVPSDAKWIFKESILMGETNLSRAQVKEIIEEMKKEYPRSSYHFIKKNCNHFSDDLCKRLVGKSIPAWVNRLAKWGEALGVGVKEQYVEEDGSLPSGAISSSSKSTKSSTSPKSDNIDLISCIDLDGVECFNDCPDHNISQILKSKPKKNEYLLSDTDATLLINIRFKQHVKLHSIAVAAPDDGSGPKHVDLIVNKYNVTFGDVENMKPTQTIEFTSEDLVNFTPVILKTTLFQNVIHLTLFVKDNQREQPRTRINRLGLFGQPLADIQSLANATKS